jgi:hypothetical protein
LLETIAMRRRRGVAGAESVAVAAGSEIEMQELFAFAIRRRAVEQTTVVDVAIRRTEVVAELPYEEHFHHFYLCYQMRKLSPILSIQ